MCNLETWDELKHSADGYGHELRIKPVGNPRQAQVVKPQLLFKLLIVSNAQVMSIPYISLLKAG